jgi:mono/diheme cytochrome c family protein
MEGSTMKWLKVAAWVVVALAALVAAAIITGLQLGERRMQRKIDVRVQPVAYRTDAQSLERGKYLFAARGCAECHGENGGGRTFVEEAGVRVKGPNISPGAGSVVAAYKPEDWVRTIRHGVTPSGRAVRVMPSEDYNRFTDDDLAALVAYVRGLPPVAGTGAVVELPLPARVLYGFGQIPDAASRIDHSLPPAQPVPEGVSLEHGKYVANMCIGCHGEKLTGGRIAGGPPDWPPAPRLVPGEGNVIPRYEKPEALLALFRTGKRADGTAVQVMPFATLREMSEVDVRALHLYLKSLPPPSKG